MDKLAAMDKPLFSATISPHRSLSPLGFAILLAVVALLNLMGGLFFWYLGAWPVVGFMGLDVVLVWLAFRWSYRRAQRHENLLVTATDVQLSRFAQNRLIERLSFPRGFVHVDIEHDVDRELIGRLYLRSRGHAYEIGSFLGGHERLALADALSRALATPKI
ncbi:MAG: DUF2244 domain-containing protein [Aestuariivirgaceae bacterium]